MQNHRPAPLFAVSEKRLHCTHTVLWPNSGNSPDRHLIEFVLAISAQVTCTHTYCPYILGLERFIPLNSRSFQSLSLNWANCDCVSALLMPCAQVSFHAACHSLAYPASFYLLSTFIMGYLSFACSSDTRMLVLGCTVYDRSSLRNLLWCKDNHVDGVTFITFPLLLKASRQGGMLVCGSQSSWAANMMLDMACVKLTVPCNLV